MDEENLEALEMGETSGQTKPVVTQEVSKAEFQKVQNQVQKLTIEKTLGEIAGNVKLEDQSQLEKVIYGETPEDRASALVGFVKTVAETFSIESEATDDRQTPTSDADGEDDFDLKVEKLAGQIQKGGGKEETGVEPEKESE